MSIKKVVLGLSGGVDSAAAAILLQEKYEVIAVTMKMFDDFDGKDAKHVADSLNIVHQEIDLQEKFLNITNYFKNEYYKGRTPNPCVFCNEQIKWQTLMDIASEVGADFIATGHYSQLKTLENDRRTILASFHKDQSYMLYRLNQAMLRKTIFPLGTWKKEDVRALVKKHGISIHQKADSQEICFIPDNNYIQYLESQGDFKELSGNFVDTDGNILGTHGGIHQFTIGQRKGIQIALGERMYVVDINPENKNITLGKNEDLFQETIQVSHIHFSGATEILNNSEYLVKIRYNHPPVKVQVQQKGDMIFGRFDEPQRGITKGQSAVFYDDHLLQFGGIIEGS